MYPTSDINNNCMEVPSLFYNIIHLLTGMRVITSFVLRDTNYSPGEWKNEVNKCYSEQHNTLIP